jgi:LuxR family maltose regulon positive regulatory protein
MSQPTTEATGARRHIIKRPRLTRLLDETTARIILLVAPAGYGKTTLAREWCGSLDGTIAWYQAGPSAQDVVALATDLSSVLAGDVGLRESLRTYLRGVDSGEVDVHALAKRFADDVDSWPEDAILVIDDYQHATQSEASEMFVGLLAENTPLRLLVASRVTPCWASARHFVYGQSLQIERAQLSMTESEVDRVLSRGCPSGVDRIRALADGWPAVIGLAALTSATKPPPAAFAETLHAYFAQELFDSLDSNLQTPLIKLSVPPRITFALAATALQEEPSHLLREADRVGFITSRGAAAYDLHPLLRQFLLGKVSLLGSNELLSLRERLFEVLINDHCWDDAFMLIAESEMVPWLPRLLRASLDELLQEGRIATIRSWLALTRRRKLDDPVVDLAQAESTLRAGELTQASFYATRAYRRLIPGDNCIFRSLCLSGLAAHLADDYVGAGSYYERAETAASSAVEVREALWGQFMVAFHLEREESENVLEKFQSVIEEQTPDDLLRIANGRFRTACLAHTSLLEVLADLRAATNFVELASNPHVICGFLVVCAQCSMLTAKYSKALEIASTGKAAADRYGLKFALPYFSAIQSFALFGLKKFGDAQAAINELLHEARALSDFHSLVNASVAQARLLLAHGDLREAIATTDDRQFRTSPPSMHGELLAVHSLSLACAGDLRGARTAVERARSVSHAIETETTALAAEAVINSQHGPSNDALPRLLHHISRSRHYDAFVAAYRAHPPLLLRSAAYSDFRELIDEIILAAGDYDWALSLGIDATVADATRASSVVYPKLSPRELEVLGLVANGLSNHDIAQKLYISTATVKVHLRHIFEKLGVRSRTQAALHPLGRRTCYATTESRSTTSSAADVL